MASVVDQLFQIKSERPVAIILQSDHGPVSVDSSKTSYAFRNYTAFYFSDQDYHTLYKSISNVNTFRIIMNKYFNTHLQLLPDSSIYLH